MSEERLERLEAENARLRAAVENALLLLEESVESAGFGGVEDDGAVTLLREALNPPDDGER